MAALIGVSTIAAISAACAGYALSSCAVSHIGHAFRLRAALGEKTPLASWLLLHGVMPFNGLARMFLRGGKCREFVDYWVGQANRRQVSACAMGVLSTAIAVLVIVFATCLLVSGSLVCGIAVDGALIVAAFSVSSAERQRARNLLRAQIPDALRSMATCSQAGLSLQQTLDQVARETSGVLHEMLSSAARKLSTGESPDVALAPLRYAHGVSELSFVAVVLDVQHQCGGSLSGVLESASETVESELELLRTLRVQTAQAKLSARIVTLMPFILIALFSFMSSDFLMPFFTSFAGIVLFAIALCMQLAGVLIVRHLLAIEVD